MAQGATRLLQAEWGLSLRAPSAPVPPLASAAALSCSIVKLCLSDSLTQQHERLQESEVHTPAPPSVSCPVLFAP